MRVIYFIIKKFQSSGFFFRSVVTMISGSILAQALTVIISPLLTRLYTPEDFGVYAMYTSILSIISVVACWRYEIATVIPEEDKEAINLLVLAIIICLGMALLTFLMFLFFENYFIKIFNIYNLSNIIWLLPISIIFNGLFEIFNYWSTRKQQFKRLALRQILQSTVTSSTQLASGIYYPNTFNLVISLMLGQIIATVNLIHHIYKEEIVLLKKFISIESIKKVFIRYKDFPLYSTWAILLNTLSAMLPPLLLGYFFNPKIAGYYALGHRVLSIPVSIIGGSISQVFFSHAADEKKKGDLDAFTRKIFKNLVSISLVPIFLLFLVAPEIFAIVFGKEWTIAGEYTRWMSLWIFFQFVSSPLSMLYMLLEKQKAFLFFNAFLIVVRIISLSIGWMHDDPLLSIKLFSITGFFAYALFCFQILHMVKISLRDGFSIILDELFKTVPFVIISIFTIFTFEQSIYPIVTSILSGVIFVMYFVYNIQNKNEEFI